jgi:hypothetical protein
MRGINSIGEVYDSNNNVVLIIRDGPHKLLLSADMPTTPFQLRDVSTLVETQNE